MRLLAHFASAVFHPFFLPTYALVLLIYMTPYRFGQFASKELTLSIIILFVLTCVFPVFSLLVMKGLDLIDSLSLKRQKSRIIPYIVISTFYFWAYMLFKPGRESLFVADWVIANMLLGISISIFSAFVINLFSKISIHTLAFGGLLGLLVHILPMSRFDVNPVISSVVLLGGFVGTSRLKLQAHTPFEVLIGYIVGYIGQFIAFRLINF